MTGTWTPWNGMDGTSEMGNERTIPLRVVLIANWGLGAAILEALHGCSNVLISLVITQYQASAGDPWKNVVYERAETLGYPVLKLSSTSDDIVRDMVDVNKADLLVVHAYDKRLSSRAFAAPLLGSINVHPSLLPRHRGRNPSLRVLELGEDMTGLMAHYIDEGFDTGPILHQVSVPVEPDDSRDSLIERMKMVVPELVDTTVAKVLVGETPVAQEIVFSDGSTNRSMHDSTV